MMNILLILTDQQRKDSLGCYGNPIVQTPNIDRLASQGIRFNRNYVANPICMPNRMSIMSGQYPRNHGMWTNGLFLQRECPTLASELAAHGYQVASFGKIHATPYNGDKNSYESTSRWRILGDDFDESGPYQGFEHVELTLGHTLDLAHYGRWFRERGGTPEMLVRHSFDGDSPGTGTRTIPPELHDSTFVGERTAAFLRKERDKSRPFFAVASFPDPHHPFDPPQAIADKYDPVQVAPPIGSSADLDTRPAHYRQQHQGSWHRSGLVEPSSPEGISQEEANRRIAYTYAMVDLIDQNVGTILNTLDEEGLRDDTVVIFTSDHGELLGDHGLWLKGPFFYEGLLNTPLIISAPGLEPRVSDALFSDVDLAPTLYELAGLPISFYVDGLSQLPHFHDPSLSIRTHCLIEYHTGYGEKDQSSKCLINRDWKYVHYQNGDVELTDLANDPAERQNLANHPSNQLTNQQMQQALLETMLATESKWPEQVGHA